MNLAEALHLIRDEGPPRADVTPLYANAEAFRTVVDALIEHTASLNWTVVAAIDALGFVLGGAIAARRNTGVVTVRKAGKLPRPGLREEFAHYTGGTEALELPDGALAPIDRVLIVDEWIETGATVAAAIRLIERAGARVVGIATLHCDPAADHAVFRGTPVVALNQL